MRPSNVSLFVVGALVVATGMGIMATRKAAQAAEDPAEIPADAVRFGFETRTHAAGIPLLESTKPFELTLPNGPVHGVTPSPDTLARGSGVVARELKRYPLMFLRKIRLAGIVMTEDLAEGDTPIPSLPNVGGLLLLDISSVESDLVRSLHHEIFHFFDLADDGSVSADSSWDALNPSSFVYGSGGRTLRGAWAARASSDIPGFVSAYATSGDEEDKADTFAFAVARPTVIHDRLATEPVLKAKVVELARRVATFDKSTPALLGLEDLLR